MGALSFNGGLSRYALRIRAAALELAILAAHVLLYPTGVLQEAVAEPPPGRSAGGGAGKVTGLPAPRLPVLLLHGFVDNRSVFALLRRDLRRNGWDQVRAVNYSPLTCDIRQAAAQLGRHVERICEQSGCHQVDIVAHSLGGLIARYYVQRLGGAVRVRTVVTLGTPHAGTRVAPLADTHPIVRQMRPHSRVMSELAEPVTGCATRFVAFWSDLDQIMVPVETARLEHADLIVRNVEVHGIGHLALPVNRSVAAGIREALQPVREVADAADAA